MLCSDGSADCPFKDHGKLPAIGRLMVLLVTLDKAYRPLTVGRNDQPASPFPDRPLEGLWISFPYCTSNELFMGLLFVFYLFA